MFYSRFFTMSNLILDIGEYLIPVDEFARISNMLERRPPNKQFMDIVEEMLKKSYTMEERDIIKQRLYDNAMHRHFDNPVITEAYLKLEKKIFLNLKNNSSLILDETLTSKRLREMFSALDRQMVAYARRSLESDCRRLSTTSERIKSFLMRNQIFLLAFGTVMIIICVFVVSLGTIHTQIKVDNKIEPEKE